MDQVNYEKTEVEHIYLITIYTDFDSHKGYVYADEAGQFSREIFATIDSAKLNLKRYMEKL